ncbi:LexA family protein [Streptomyces sp. NPDC002755]
MQAQVGEEFLESGAASPVGPGGGVGAGQAQYIEDHVLGAEEEILARIRHSIRDRGEALSVRELAREVGMNSPASVVCHLRNLEVRGALVRDGRGWRSCRLTG